MIHLDTSFLIHALVPSSKADRRLRQWLRDGEDLAISSIAWTEFLCGPVSGDHVDVLGAVFQEIVPFVADDSELTARLFNAGGRRRGTLADCMIAAVAIRAEASLVTANPKDFERFAPDSLKIL